MSGPKREEVAGGWRKLHTFYTSPNVIRGMKSRRMNLAEHVARMGKIKMHTKFLSGHLK